jgi:nucleotide-binding universal stress UspA family protein
MVERVLVPVDGSEPAEAALEHALETFPDAELTLLTVIDPAVGIGTSAGAPGGSELWYESMRERAEATLEAGRERAAEHGREAETVTETGRPASTIVDYAAEHGVDGIVIGSHGRQGVSRLLLGSVAETVVRRAPCPVTVVR